MFEQYIVLVTHKFFNMNLSDLQAKLVRVYSHELDLMIKLYSN